MKFVPGHIPGVWIIEPDVFKDERGFFLETFNSKRYQEHGINEPFVQDNHSRSVKNTLRGLHSQRENPQGKLVHVIRGEIFDVGVDIREGSPTYGQWVSEILTEENHKQIYLPPGFVHGFCVLSDRAEVEYKCTALYDPKDEIGVRWDDPEIGIKWPVTNPILSEKDKKLPTLEQLRSKI